MIYSSGSRHMALVAEIMFTLACLAGKVQPLHSADGSSIQTVSLPTALMHLTQNRPTLCPCVVNSSRAD